MWFKSTQYLQYETSKEITAEFLEEALTAHVFQPCLPSFPRTQGWVPPIGIEGAPMVHAGNGYFMICLQLEEKILPASVIRHHVTEQIKEIEARDERKVSRKEKVSLKEEMVHTLLPKAFSKLTPLYAYFDPKLKALILETTSASHTEIFMEAFKKALPGIRVTHPSLKKMTTQMTHWLVENALPDPFDIEKACVLQDPTQQGRVIRCNQQDLYDRPIQTLVKEGCEVQQLALSWDTRMQFNLTQEFLMKQIKFSEELREMAEVSDKNDALQTFDADFVMMTATFTQLYQQLLPLVLEKETATATATAPALAEAE